jgi:hypothetical protein
MATAKAEIEFTPGYWTDVSQWLNQFAGITITRGRSSEAGSIEPGTCSFRLINDDGRFTPGLSSSPYYPNVVQGRRVRISLWVNGAWDTRFTGHIADLTATGWDDETAKTTEMAVSLVDALAWFARPLRSSIREILAHYGAVAYWPLTETSGVSYGEVLGRGFPSLQVRQMGKGGALAGGEGAAAPVDPSGVLEITAVDATDGPYLESARVVDLGSEWTIGCWIGDLPASPSATALTVQQGERIARAHINWVGSVYASEFAHDADWSYRTPPGPYVSGTASRARSWLMLSVSESAIAMCPDAYLSSESRVSWADDYDRAILRVGWDDDTPGRLSIGGSVGHLFVLPTALTPAEMVTLSDLLMQSGASMTAADWPFLALQYAGGPTGGTTLGEPPTGALALDMDGRSVLDYATDYAAGTGSRGLAIARDGAPMWVDVTYLPTPVALTATTVDPAMRYGTNPGYLSDGSITLVDGSYSFAKTSPVKLASYSAQGVYLDDAASRATLEWIVNKSDDSPRIPSASLDLLGLSDSDQQTVAAVDIGSRLQVSGLPSQIPGAMDVAVEGYVETIDSGWQITYNLAPDPYISVGRWDDDTWDDGKLWSLFGTQSSLYGGLGDSPLGDGPLGD